MRPEEVARHFACAEEERRRRCCQGRVGAPVGMHWCACAAWALRGRCVCARALARVCGLRARGRCMHAPCCRGGRGEACGLAPPVSEGKAPGDRVGGVCDAAGIAGPPATCMLRRVRACRPFCAKPTVARAQGRVCIVLHTQPTPSAHSAVRNREQVRAAAHPCGPDLCPL